jgi:hypothetical protein
MGLFEKWATKLDGFSSFSRKKKNSHFGEDLKKS